MAVKKTTGPRTPPPATQAKADAEPGAELYRQHRLRLEGGQPLYAALSAALPGLSKVQARRAVIAGLCRLDGHPEISPSRQLEAPAQAELDLRQGIRRSWVKVRHGQASVSGPGVKILHVDSDIVVIDKAAGVDAAPVEDRRGHAADLLRRQLRAQGHEAGFIGQVHRLDRDTSGCLCFAVNREAQRILAAQFAGSAAVRIYRCLVAGQPPDEVGTIAGRQGRGRDGRRALITDGPGVEAVTRYRVLRRYAATAELEVTLDTGRTHQIRVALASIGCPVIGDRIYAKGSPAARAPRLMLHAERLELDHPSAGRRLTVVAPLPPEYLDFAGLLHARPDDRAFALRPSGRQGPMRMGRNQVGGRPGGRSLPGR